MRLAVGVWAVTFTRAQARTMAHLWPTYGVAPGPRPVSHALRARTPADLRTGARETIAERVTGIEGPIVLVAIIADENR